MWGPPSRNSNLAGLEGIQICIYFLKVWTWLWGASRLRTRLTLSELELPLDSPVNLSLLHYPLFYPSRVQHGPSALAHDTPFSSRLPVSPPLCSFLSKSYLFCETNPIMPPLPPGSLFLSSLNAWLASTDCHNHPQTALCGALLSPQQKYKQNHILGKAHNLESDWPEF